MNELEQNYLEHHGILGQKWGIRRYQNPDGSLTAAGRKRYGIGEEKAKELIKLEKENPSEFNTALSRIDAVREFEKRNPESKELLNANRNKAVVGARINMEANAAARKAVGGQEWFTLVQRNDREAMAKYLDAGKKYAESEVATKEMKKALERLDKAERAYEKKGREFIEDLLGEYGKMESENPMSLKYDKTTGKLSQQTLADRAAYELYRRSGGRPRG